jgi:maltooligosyltrehalose synthase
MGAEVWRDTGLKLPGAVSGQTFRNVLTRETLTVASGTDGIGLPVAQALGRFPVALLERAP